MRKRAIVGGHACAAWRTLRCAVVAALWCAGGVWAADLAEGWKSGELWQQKKAEQKRGSFLRDGKNSFGDISLGEVVYTWRDEEPPKDGGKGEDDTAETPAGDLQKVVCMVYNKGDDGEIDKKEFDAMFDRCAAELETLCGKKGRLVQLPASKTGVKVKALQWLGDNGALRLECAITAKKKEKTMEFIRLVLAPDAATLDKGGAQDKIGRRDLRSNVSKDDDGTVWIKNIPMVDQGSKGYCVPATVARVFAYYGMDKVDMHALAAACKSSASGGTSIAIMAEALKDIGRSFHIKVKPLSKPSGSHTDSIKDYNREAKKLGKPELGVGGFMDDWFLGIDDKLWVEVRAKKQGDVRKWIAPIRKSIDAGIPVLWSVFASGLYNHEAHEEGGGAGGAHMRMIIGYNSEKNTIIYSDSWGDWAAKRTMTSAEAYSVTVTTYALSPTN